MLCINKNSREYQTLKKLSGLSDFVLSAYVGDFLETHDRFPYLDELPEADSSKAISEDLSLKKDNTTKTENILLATNTNTVEEAVPVLNDRYRDKEIEVLEVGSKSKVYITTRPNTTQNQNGETDKLIKIATEMADIKERALANGTFMLAPNGRQTHLTEQLWLQVRTLEFKDWFGDWENNPANASKVVDENGEPKVMYHGTPWGSFNIFNPLAPNTGDRTHPGEIFFSSVKWWADTYTTGTFNKGIKTPKTYGVFLNIRNPYKNSEPTTRAEANAILFEDFGTILTEEEYDSIYRKLDERNAQNRQLELTPHLYDVYEIISEYFKQRGDVARFNNVMKKAITSGFNDGMIYLTREEWQGKPVIFENGVKRLVWVMSPNQIKSATDNSGLFSSSNDNINDDYENVNSFAFFNEIIDKLQTLYGINIIPITNAELSQDRWASITGTKGVKSFIYNGNIYINTDIATVDSPVHEFLHLLFGSMKYLNRALYDLLVGQAEQFDSYDTISLNYPNRTKGDINEEVFVTELAKYLTRLNNAISNLDLSILNEIIYNVNRTLDTILMGENSVKCIENPYIMNLKTLAKLVNSSTMISEKRGSLSDATLNRMMANTKSELMRNKELREECQ